MEPSRDTDRDGNGRLQRAHTGDERLNSSFTAGPEEPTNGIGERSFALSAVASAAAAWSGALPLRCGLGNGREIPHPASATARSSSRHPKRMDRTVVCRSELTARHRAILPLASTMSSVAAMGIYAKRPARMIGQLLGDGFVLLWTIGWAIVAIFVHRVIEVLATPARETAKTAARLADNFRQAAEEAAKVPVAGDQLRRPLDSAAVTLGNLIDLCQRARVKASNSWRYSSAGWSF